MECFYGILYYVLVFTKHKLNYSSNGLIRNRYSSYIINTDVLKVHFL